jgi:pyridinium-3,5-bisthiocarboxylic acid mononucleotide nickel chelatase
MNILFIDAFSGVSGDKMVSALLDMGVDFEFFKDELSKLLIQDEYILELSKKNVMGINSNYFKVVLKSEHHHEHSHGRHLSNILSLIVNSGISENAKNISSGIFKIIAEAESKVHGVSIEEIHFHEVGAVDSIIDIVGTAILLDFLKIDKIFSTEIPLGNGFVKTDHGLLPVPAPATAEILRGIPVIKTDIQGELTTPTGAAIIKYAVNEFKHPDSMISEKIGYGAGTKDFEIPNILRIEYGEINENKITTDRIIKLETNIDDSTGEQIAFLCERLFQKGALDAFTMPITMKKGRPAVLLTVLCAETNRIELEKEIFKNSTTFGIRRNEMERTILEREFKEIIVNDHKVRIKFGYYDGKLVQKSFEYEDIKKITEDLSISFNEAVELVIKNIKYL